MPPAPGQGAIALEIRREDDRMMGLVGSVDDVTTRVTVEAERQLLRATGGGCRAPVGAYGEIHGSELWLIAGHAEPDGTGLRIGRKAGSVADGTAIAVGLHRELWTVDVDAGAAP
jgi:hydroxymethylbilane synthase